MTTKGLAAAVLPYARTALARAKPEAKAAVGPAWLLLWPAWGILTGPLLPFLVRVAVELGVGLTAPWLLPVVEVLLPFAPIALKAFLNDLRSLLRPDPAALTDCVHSALQARPYLASPWWDDPRSLALLKTPTEEP